MFTSTAARDLLRAFDVCDDDPQARAFLAGLITSGMAPPDEVAKLCRLAEETVRDRGEETTQEAKRRKKKRRRRRSSSSVPEAEQQAQEGLVSVAVHAAVKDEDDAADGKVSHFFATEAEQPWDGPPTQTTTTVVMTTRTTVLWPASCGGGSDGERSNGTNGNGRTDLAPPATPSTPSPRKALRTTTTTTPTTVSPFFTSSSPTPRTPHTPDTPSRRSRRRRRPGGCVSGLPVPPLAAPAFGLVQERLAADPFWLLVALVFLTRVAGRVSLPVFWALRARYPTPAALAAAAPAALAAPMRHLGMAAVRAIAIQRLARRWLAQPPQPGVCTVVRGYGDGNDGDAAASEIGHITQGPYAIDSWRIFCRDMFLGRSTDWKGDGGRAGDGGGTFQPEWMRVRPRDKELRACLRWMWMREGWEWDPATGDRTVLRETLRQAVDQGRVDYDDEGALQIVDVAEEE